MCARLCMCVYILCFPPPYSFLSSLYLSLSPLLLFFLCPLPFNEVASCRFNSHPLRLSLRGLPSLSLGPEFETTATAVYVHTYKKMNGRFMDERFICMYCCTSHTVGRRSWRARSVALPSRSPTPSSMLLHGMLQMKVVRGRFKQRKEQRNTHRFTTAHLYVVGIASILVLW